MPKSSGVALGAELDVNPVDWLSPGAVAVPKETLPHIELTPPVSFAEQAAEGTISTLSGMTNTFNSLPFWTTPLLLLPANPHINRLLSFKIAFESTLCKVGNIIRMFNIPHLAVFFAKSFLSGFENTLSSQGASTKTPPDHKLAQVQIGLMQEIHDTCAHVITEPWILSYTKQKERFENTAKYLTPDAFTTKDFLLLPHPTVLDSTMVYRTLLETDPIAAKVLRVGDMGQCVVSAAAATCFINIDRIGRFLGKYFGIITRSCFGHELAKITADSIAAVVTVAAMLLEISDFLVRTAFLTLNLLGSSILFPCFAGLATGIYQTLNSTHPGSFVQQTQTRDPVADPQSFVELLYSVMRDFKIAVEETKHLYDAKEPDKKVEAKEEDPSEAIAASLNSSIVSSKKLKEGCRAVTDFCSQHTSTRLGLGLLKIAAGFTILGNFLSKFFFKTSRYVGESLAMGVRYFVPGSDASVAEKTPQSLAKGDVQEKPKPVVDSSVAG